MRDCGNIDGHQQLGTIEAVTNTKGQMTTFARSVLSVSSPLFGSLIQKGGQEHFSGMDPLSPVRLHTQP